MHIYSGLFLPHFKTHQLVGTSWQKSRATSPSSRYIIVLKWDSALSQTKRQKLKVACLWGIFMFFIILLEWLGSLYLEFIKVFCTIIWLKLSRFEHFNELGTCWLLTVKSKKNTHQMLSKQWPPQILLCISSLHIYYYCIITHYMSKGRRMYLGVWLQAHTLYFLTLYRKHSLLTLSAVTSEGWTPQPLSFCYLCYTIITKSIPLRKMGTNIEGTYV